MRIVNLISGKDLGGSKQSFVHYSHYLTELGHHVTSVIRPRAKVLDLLNQRGLNSQIVTYPRSQLIGFKQYAIKSLTKLFKELEPDLVIIHKPIDALLIKPCLPSHTKLVLVLHSYTHKHLNFADLILPVSSALHDYIVQHGYDKPVCIMPNLVEVSQPPPNITPLDKTTIKLVHMGIFRRTKGQDLLLQALAKLHQENLSFSAKLAGTGRWFNKIKRQIKQQGLEDKVTLAGWINNDQRESFLATTNAVIIPSRQETFGMLAIEAMAQKKLVIATRCGGPETIIQHQVTGLLADIHSDDIAAQIKHLSQMSQKQYHAICQQGYQHVVDHYSQTPFKQRLQMMLDQVMS